MEEGEASTSKSMETSLRKLRILASSLINITRKCDEQFHELDVIGGKIAEEQLWMEEYMKQLSKRVEENTLLIQLREKEIEELRLQNEIVREQSKDIEEWENALERTEKFWFEHRKIIGEEKRDQFVSRLNEKFKELKVKGKEFEHSCRKLKTHGDLESISQCIKLSEIQLEVKEAELKKKQRDRSLSQFGLKENSLHGNFLQIFLNENHEKHHTSMPHVSAFAIQQSPDPAKFVLEAIQGFYPPHLMNGNVKLQTWIVKRSCVIILEELMKLSPTIGADVNREAKKVVHEWTNKMKNDFLDVLAFLLLLGTYKLASHFGDGVLCPLLKVVAGYPQFHQLLEVLGIEEENRGIY